MQFLRPDMTEEESQQVLEQVGYIGENTIMKRTGLQVTRIGYDFVEGTMPVAGNLQPMGLFHGGAHVVLAESLASTHAFARSNGKGVVGVDLNATHVRGVREGTVHGRAEVVHAGRTIINHEVRMTDDDGNLLSIVLITNYVLQKEQGSIPRD